MTFDVAGGDTTISPPESCRRVTGNVWMYLPLGRSDVRFALQTDNRLTCAYRFWFYGSWVTWRAAIRHRTSDAMAVAWQAAQTLFGITSNTRRAQTL